MKDIVPILQSLGFLDSEMKTYLASLQNGPSTVLELTKHTNLSRQATYVVIDELTERGLMSSVLRGKKKYYVAEDPDKLLSYAQRKEAEMKDRLHDLEQLLPEMKLRVGGEKPVVKYFEGKEGYRTVVADIRLSKAKVLYEILDYDAKKAILPREEGKNVKDALEKTGMKMYGFYAGTPRGESGITERYYLPEGEKDFNSCIAIYDDKIAFFTYTGKIHSIIIENKDLTRAMEILFKRAFKGAGDLKNEKISQESPELEVEEKKKSHSESGTAGKRELADLRPPVCGL